MSSRLSGSAGRSPHGGFAILSRYALVLDIVYKSPQGGFALSEIGQRTGLPQATVYRLVHALVHVGFLAAGERRRHYVLGPRLLRLMSAGVPGRKAHLLAQPILDRLVVELGETAFIAKLEGNAVETVGVATPDGTLQAFIQPGRMLPFHAAASAKAILAYADDYLRENVLQKSHQRFTSRTKTDRTEIVHDLVRIRDQGFAISDQELDSGVVSYACPVKTGSSAVVYSLGVVGFAERLGRAPVDIVVAALKAAARDFSTILSEEQTLSPRSLPAWHLGPGFSRGEDGLAADR